MDVTATATLAMSVQSATRGQEASIAMTKMAIESQTQAASSLITQVADQAKAAAAQARGGIDIIA